MILSLPFHLPFASAITIWPCVLVSRDVASWSERTRDLLLVHESVHLAQQRRWFVRGLGVGLLAWWLLYLLCLPIGWNPFRRRAELEAYRAQGVPDSATMILLRLAPYWLRW